MVICSDENFISLNSLEFNKISVARYILNLSSPVQRGEFKFDGHFHFLHIHYLPLLQFCHFSAHENIFGTSDM